jgi:hypothetical protein
METIEQKLDTIQLKLEHLELKILRKIMEKENEEKRSTSHTP